MTDVVFRQAKTADIEAMSQIRLAVKENVLSNPDRVTRQMYVDYLEVLGRGWVCEYQSQIVAFSYANKTDSSIWALFVKPGFEGCGYAKQLLNLATEYLFSLGNQQVTLSTDVNTRAERFYASQGWLRGAMLDEFEIEFKLHNTQ
jgi:ribosomal protein S18 acetylase RimI-like enzyme